MILDDLKEYLDGSGVSEGAKVFLNYDAATAREDVVVLMLCGSSVSDVGEKAVVRVSVKCTLMQDAERIAHGVFDLFYPKKQYQRLMDICGSKMYILAGGVPFYSHRDESGRHCFVFDLNIVRGRAGD